MLIGITVESKLEAYELWNTLDYARIMYEGGLAGTADAIDDIQELTDVLFARSRLAARVQNELKGLFTLNVDDR